MTDDDKLVSMSGAPIYRHKAQERPFELATGSEDLEHLSGHIERWVGPIELVFHELISDLVHVDVHWVKPSDQRPFHTLVTTGMSDLPMHPPEGAEECKCAELLVELPADWPLSEEAFKSEANYWPIRLLKFFARFPHEYGTWLWWGHTIPNGDPPKPLDESVAFTGAILLPAVNLPPEFRECRISDQKEVSFFAVVPLYREEMDYKLRHGTEAVCDQFDKHSVSELIDVRRRNAVKRRWFLR